MAEQIEQSLNLKLDRTADVPLFAQLKAALHAAIEAGVYGPGEMIPTEQQLQRLAGISRSTVRQAVGDLVAQGILQRHVGKGTFVAPLPVGAGLHDLMSFTQTMRAQGRVPGARVFEIATAMAPAPIAEALGLIRGESVLKIERVRTADGEVIGLHTSYLPTRYGYMLSIEDFTQTGSLYLALARKYKVVFTRAEATVEATVANDREAGLLGLEPKGAVLLVQQVTFTADGRPVEFARELYRGDRYRFFGLRLPVARSEHSADGRAVREHFPATVSINDWGRVVTMGNREIGMEAVEQSHE